MKDQILNFFEVFLRAHTVSVASMFFKKFSKSHIKDTRVAYKLINTLVLFSQGQVNSVLTKSASADEKLYVK